MAANANLAVHCLCVNAGIHSYRWLIREDAHPVFVEYPQMKVRKILYKIWPSDIINALEAMRKEIRPDVVHFLTGDFTLAHYICLHKDKTFCYTVHDLHPHETVHKHWYGAIFEIYILWCNKRIRDKVKRLTTSSQSQFTELCNIYGDKTIRFTHFPSLMNEIIANGTKEPKELKGVGRYVLFFGNVNIYKGVDVLVESFKISKLHKTHKLVVAGRGSMYNDVMRDEHIIRIDRFIGDEEIRCLFTGAEFIVYPYRSATMSGVLSLAFYFHKRVILSDIPFFCDNACELTTFFKNGDMEDLKDKLDTFLCSENTCDELDDCYVKIYSDEQLQKDYTLLYRAE